MFADDDDDGSGTIEICGMYSFSLKKSFFKIEYISAGTGMILNSASSYNSLSLSLSLSLPILTAIFQVNLG